MKEPSIGSHYRWVPKFPPLKKTSFQKAGAQHALKIRILPNGFKTGSHNHRAHLEKLAAAISLEFNLTQHGFLSRQRTALPSQVSTVNEIT